MEEGIEKGKIAGKTEVAKALLAEGMDITTIAKVTRLSISKIEKLT